MAAKPTKGTVVSFGNTPQAKDDNFIGLGTEDSSGVIYLDVMANDLAGNGKSMWAIDDAVSAGGIRPEDLLAKDTVGVQETSKLGAKIWITADGKVAYQLTDALRSFYQSLAPGQTVVDTFTYAIQMGNGTLSWAQASFTIAGTNDRPVVQDVAIAAVEDGPSVTASFVGDDVDSDDDGASLQYTLTSTPATGILTNNGNGTFTYDSDGEFQELAAGETATLNFTYTATDKHGAVSDPAGGTITVTGVNDAPSLQAGAAGAVEDGGTITVDLSALGNDIDSDDDGASLTYTLLNTPPANSGSAALKGTTLSFSPGTDFQQLALGETQVVTLSVEAQDKHGATAVNTVEVTVTGTNDAPAAEHLFVTAQEDGAAVGGSFVGDDVDSDDDVNSLGYTLSGVPGGGTLANNGDGTFTFDPGADFQGLAEGEITALGVTYTATDKHGAVSGDASLKIHVVGVNDAPTLQAGTLGVEEDGPAGNLDLSALGDDVDSDNDGSDLVYTLVVPVSGGSQDPNSESKGGPEPLPPPGFAAISGTTLTYDPAGQFEHLALGETADITLHVKATDAHGASAINQVTATVTGANDAPTLASGGSISVVEDGEAATLDLSGLGGDVDSDDDGSTLTYTLLTTPAQGSATISGTTLTFDPGSEYQQLAQDQQVFVDVKVQATDQHGASVVDTVRLEVTGVNDAPQFLAGDTEGAVTQVPLTVMGPFDIEYYMGSLTDSGPLLFRDADLVDIHSVSTSAPGLTLGTFSAVITKDSTNFAAPGVITWNYSVDNKTVDYLGAGESITNSYDVTVSDGKGGSATRTVNVVVNGVNDAPFITSGTDQAQGNTMEDTVLSVSGQVTIHDVDNTDTHTWGIATNTSGAYGTASVDGNGKWTYTVANGTNGAASPVQSLKQGETVVETFVVRASDGKGGNADQVVHVVVAGVNDAAVIGTQSVTLTETNAPLGTGGTLSIADIDSAAQFNAQSLAGKYGSFALAADGKWTYAMNGAHDEFEQGKNYVETFSVVSVDGTVQENAVTVTIAGTNDAPVAVDDSNAVTVTSLASQVNTTTVKWVDWTEASAGVVKGVIDLGGGQKIDVTYTGAYNFAQTSGGTDFYTTPATVPGDFTLGTGTYTSAGVANGPTGPDLIGLELATSRTLTFSQPVDDLFFAVVSLNGNGYRFDQDFDILSYGRGYFGDGSAVKTALPDGRYELLSVNTPGRNELHGVIGIKGSVTSLTWDGLSNEYWNGFTVGTYGKAQTAVATGNLLANDSDPEHNPIEVAIVNGQGIAGNSITLTLASGARLTVNKNGSYSYDENGAFASLAEGQTTVDSFNYLARDSLGATSNLATASITVTGINDAPTFAAGGSISVIENGAPATLDLSTLGDDVDSDDDGGSLAYTLASIPAQGTVTLAGSTLSFAAGSGYQELNAGHPASVTVDVKATDKHGASTIGQVTLNITGVNDLPTLKAATIAANEDGGNVVIDLDALGDDVDFEDDGGTLQYSIVAQPPAGKGIVSISGTGASQTLTYDTAGGFQSLAKGMVEQVQFPVQVTDAQGASVVQTFTANVTGTNDAPTVASGGTMTVSQGGPAGSFPLSTLGDDIDSDDTGATLFYLVSAPGLPSGATVALHVPTRSLLFDPGSNYRWLSDGEALPVTVLVEARDRHGASGFSTVTVNVVGTNDAPAFYTGDVSGSVTAATGDQTLKLEQWTNYGGGFDESSLRNFANANKANYTISTAVVDFTDDPGGFAGDIPGSMAWPAALATGASGTDGINDHFFARLTGKISVEESDTYTFRTFNDDGVYLRVNNKLVISDSSQHPEAAFTGDIALEPGVYTVELFFFENGGEASLEFTMKDSSGSYGHVVSTQQLGDTGVMVFRDLDLNDTHTVDVSSGGGNLGSMSAQVAVQNKGDATVIWNYAVDSEALAYLGAGATRVETFTVTLSDNHGATANQQVNVTLTGINDAPVANNDSATVNEDGAVVISVLANDTDPDSGDTKSLVSVGNGEHGTVASLAGSVFYTPHENFNGTDSFTYTIKDAAGLTSTATVTVTVKPVSDSYTVSNLVQNGSFEAGPGASWQTLGEGVDFVTGGAWQGADGGTTVDLNAFDKGGVAQTLTTVPGQTYTGSFMLSQNPGVTGTSTVHVAAAGFGGNFSYNEPNTEANMMWQQKTFSFVATSTSTVLSFNSLTPTLPQGHPGDAQGPALDEVVVVGNTVITGFTTGTNSDVLDLRDLMSSINAPHDTSAIINGFVQFLPSGSDTLVRIDANGGGDNYLTVATLVGVIINPAVDTNSYLL